MPPFDHFDFFAPFYERFIPPNEPHDLLRLLEIPDGAFLLDVGGGTGRVSRFLLRDGVKVCVADLSYPMLLEAGRKSGLLPACSQSENLPFSDCVFDRVVMVDALHHVRDQQVSTGELIRVLKKGGRLIIEEPDIRSWVVWLIALAEKLVRMRSHFLSLFQIEDLFRSSQARVEFTAHDHTVWVVVDKPI